MTDNSGNGGARDDRLKRVVAELRVKNADAIERRRLSGFGLPDSEKTPEQKAYSVYKLDHEIAAARTKEKKIDFIFASIVIIAVAIFSVAAIKGLEIIANNAPPSASSDSEFCQTTARTFEEQRFINEVCEALGATVLN